MSDDHQGSADQFRGDIPAWAAYLFPPLIAVLGFLPSFNVLGSRYLGADTTDMWLYFRHAFRFAVESLASGQVPLWNPHILCGTPFLPSTCATLWYPANWLPLFLLPQPLSLNLIIIFHTALLGVFTVYYARVRDCSNTAALFAGMVIVICSLPATRIPAGHITIICTVAWIPMLFALQERLFTRGLRYIIPFGAAGACAFLAGHLQFVYYCLLLLSLNIVLTAVLQRRGLRWLLLQAATHASAGIIAFGLAAVEVLPVLNTMRYSVRAASKGAEWLGYFSMPPENLLTMIAPGFFGRGADYTGRFFWWEVCFYIGIVPLTLAVTAIGRQLRERRLSNHTILLVTAMVLSMIGLLGPLGSIGYVIPGWTLFRGHAKILGIGVVFAVMLSAEGFEAVVRDLRGSAAKTATAVAGFIAAFTAVLYLGVWAQGLWQTDATIKARLAAGAAGAVPLWESAAKSALLTPLVFVCATVGLLLVRRRIPRIVVVSGLTVIAVLDLGLFALPLYNVTFSIEEIPQPPAELVSFAQKQKHVGRTEDLSTVYRKQEVGMNEAVSFDYESAGGCDFNITRYCDTYISAYQGNVDGAAHLSLVTRLESPLLDCANLRYLMVPNSIGSPPGFNATKRMDAGDVSLFERNSALPRAYVVGTADWAPDDDVLLADKLRAQQSFQRDVILCEPGLDVADESYDAVPAEVIYHGAQELSVTAPRAGWLVVCDSYYPLWRAWVNDKPARIFRANGAFRAVRVSAGDSVIMRYANPWFGTGAAVSGVMVLGTGIVLFLLTRRRGLPLRSRG